MDNSENGLRILILEDEATDAELVERHLRDAGLAIQSRRVDRPETFVKALIEFKPEIVLCDFKLPTFDGLTAVKLVRQEDPDLPVIVVTGALGDEAAIELVKAGANDYILKDRLARLPYAIRHALAEREEVRQRRRAESALQASERKFRNLVESTSDWIWETNEEGVFTYASPRTRGILGYEPKALIGKKPSDLFMSEAARRLGESFDPQSNNHEPFALVEATARHKDGHEVVLEISAVPAFEADVYCGYRGIARDITERKRAIGKILETEARFFTIFNSVSDGIFVSDASTGVFIDVNEAACKMCGHRREELIGADFGVLSSGVPPYTQAEAFRWYERARAGLVQPFAWHCKAKDGRLFWAEISMRCVPFGDRIVGLASFRDITPRKEAETALAASELRYRRLFETSQDGMLIIEESNGEIVDVNPSLVRLMGYPREEFVGMSLWESRFLKDVVASQAAFEDLRSKGCIHRSDLQFENKDGCKVDVELACNAFFVDGRKFIQCSIRDIGLRKRAERDLGRIEVAS
jgi:PAS domain S-box-containing protein